MLFAACGGRQEPIQTRTTIQPRSISLPDPVPAEPSFRLAFDRAVRAGMIERIDKQRGVMAVAALRTETIRVRAGDRSKKLRVGSIAPLSFRSVSPASTRSAEFVWTSLIQEQAVLTPDAAQALKVEGAETLVIEGTEYQVGAFADNGVPNFVDILLANHATEALDLPPAHKLVVGTKATAKLPLIRKALAHAAPRARIKVLRAADPPVAPEALGQAQGSLIGTMSFRIKKNGFIEPDPAWVSANIVSATVPILGQVTCHRLLIPQLAGALTEIEDEGLSDLIDPGDYGGCYVPRFIGRDARRALSMHAFGLAVDLNVSRNYYGTRGHMDVRIVSIFDRWGFRWGGSWSPPDPMHFELARLLDT
jgi:hypothetical protein